MPSKAKPSDGADLNLFSAYDNISSASRIIDKKRKNHEKDLRPRERLPPPANGALPPTTAMDEDTPFFDDVQAMAENTRYMGVLERKLAKSALNAMPWYMVITNEAVREELQDLARDEFYCAECGSPVVEIENRGRWQCQMPVTWRPSGAAPGEFKPFRFMVRADHRKEGAPLWNDRFVSTIRVPASVLAIMDATAKPIPEALVWEEDNSAGAAKMQRAIESQDTDARMAEQFVRDSRVIVRYSASAMRTVVRILDFYKNEKDSRLRNIFIREAMEDTFDMSMANSRFSIRSDPSGASLYILKKEMNSH